MVYGERFASDQSIVGVEKDAKRTTTFSLAGIMALWCQEKDDAVILEQLNRRVLITARLFVMTAGMFRKKAFVSCF